MRKIIALVSMEVPDEVTDGMAVSLLFSAINFGIEEVSLGSRVTEPKDDDDPVDLDLLKSINFQYPYVQKE